MTPVVCIYCHGPVDGAGPHRCRTTPQQRSAETRLRQRVADGMRRGRVERTYLSEQFLAGRSLAEVAYGAGIPLEDVRARLRGGA